MEHTIPLQTISTAWMDTLKASTRIQEYCKSHYGRGPVLINGGNPREAPDGDYCPYIVVMNGSKIEGDNQSVLSYTIGVGWVVKNNTIQVDGETKTNAYYPDAHEIILNGAVECDELGQIIYEELQEFAAGRDWPISRIDYDATPSATYPQFTGTMICITEITPSMGEELTY